MTAAEACRRWRTSHPERAIASAKKYKELHPERIKASERRWASNNPEKKQEINRRYRVSGGMKEYMRKRRSTPRGKLENSTRRRMWRFLKGKDNTPNTRELIGCSWEELKSHLESLWKEGMSWKNYGRIWHVDHIIPCSWFDFSDTEQVKRCFNWTNVQPLSAVENLRKGAKNTAAQILERGF